MEFKSAEEKLLHDYAVLEDENARLDFDNGVLAKRVETLEQRIADLGEQAHRLMVERDHAIDCVKDISAAIREYGLGGDGDAQA